MAPPVPKTSLLEDPERTASDALAIGLRGVSRRFGATWALRDVSLGVRPGEIHALLGPNGAGKTTLLRIFAGLVEPAEGEVQLLGSTSTGFRSRRDRQRIGLVPSGDRSFYLRISGLENLIFFGRMHGLRRSDAGRRAWECLRAVHLEEAARKQVGVYSHGMQKRLSVARAIIMDPPVLLVDEATHDLDPDGARRIKDLARSAAAGGSAIIWATQRVDEIRDLADRLTLLHKGRVRFAGTVPEFMATRATRTHLIHLRGLRESGAAVLQAAQAAVGEIGTLRPAADPDAEHYLLGLRDGATLGEAISKLTGSDLVVLDCREERSGIEEAFLHLTGEEGS